MVREAFPEPSMTEPSPSESSGSLSSEPSWEFPEPPTDLIFDDGEPLESNRHRIAMNVLIDGLVQAYTAPIAEDQPLRTDFFVGGNMFVYYSREQRMNRDFRGPDFFAVLEVDGTRERQGWVVWEEEGRYPDVIVELMSPSTAHIDKTEKKTLYEKTFHTLDYFVYDPFDPSSLEGWHLNAHRHYEPISPNERGWLWCETLELWLGLWEGTVQREPASGTCFWLRFFDRHGNLVPLAAERAEQERQRAEEERQRAEEERQRAEQERQRAEQERQRAEQESLRAEQERQRAEQAEQRAALLAAQLRELGIDPERL